jgi:hypothetical protein
LPWRHLITNLEVASKVSDSNVVSFLHWGRQVTLGHYYEMWVQFINPYSLCHWIQSFLIRSCSLQLVNSLNIKWNHFTYKDERTFFVVRVILPLGYLLITCHALNNINLFELALPLNITTYMNNICKPHYLIFSSNHVA